jgi:hypothetical protein
VWRWKAEIVQRCERGVKEVRLRTRQVLWQIRDKVKRERN